MGAIIKIAYNQSKAKEIEKKKSLPVSHFESTNRTLAFCKFVFYFKTTSIIHFN